MLLLPKRRVPTREVSRSRSRGLDSKNLLTKLTLLPELTTKKRNASGLNGGHKQIPQIHSLKVFLLMADLLRTLLQPLEDVSQPTKPPSTYSRSRAINRRLMCQLVISI